MERARYLAWLAWSLSGLYLAAILGFGLLFVTIDWHVMACFDGVEPACNEPSERGLAAVRGISWLLAVLAVAASVTALVLAYRVRRYGQLAPVVLLCMSSVVIATTLWLRL